MPQAVEPSMAHASVAASEPFDVERGDHDEHDDDNEQRGEDDDDNDDSSINEPPLHPIPAMQEAFEESIADAADGEDDRPLPHADPDPEIRRTELLDRKEYNDSLVARWNLKPTAKSHPLVKLMAQIIFGLHLLHQSQAKSDAEVVKILQTHVDEIDKFLERTTEDFEAAENDIQKRISYLKLPMTHLEVFDVMLDDRKFRNQLIDGNDRIEKVIERSAAIMNAAVLDVRAGLAATMQLASYLYSVQTTWPQSTSEQAAILVAMRGNQEGWAVCMRESQHKADVLRESLTQLGTVIGEMSKLAAAASRRNHAKLKPTKSTRSVQSPRYDRFVSPGSQRSPGQSPYSPPQRKPSVAAAANKPLPHEFNAFDAAVRATEYTASNDDSSMPEERWMNPRSAPIHPSPGHLNTFQPSLAPRNSHWPASAPRNSHWPSSAPAVREPLTLQTSINPGSRQVNDDYNYRVEPSRRTSQRLHEHRSNPNSRSGSSRHDSLPDNHAYTSPQHSSRSGSIDILSPHGLDGPKVSQWPVSEFSPKEKTGPSFSMRPIKKLFNRKKDQALYI